ncbi:MAG TPA: hypothetical protein PKC49_06170 [Phycisphaerae bacterium]|nr:hypothetical protein [Phycisphaerae bacterium]
MGSSPISYDQIVALVLGELPPDEQQAVRQAVQHSPDLATRLDRLERVVACLRRDDSVAPTPRAVALARDVFAQMRPAEARDRGAWLQRLGDFVATLTYDSRTQAALVGFRGGAETYQLSFAHPSAEVDLEVEAPPERNAQRRVTGQVHVLEAGAGAVTSLDVLLMNEGVAVARASGDPQGLFTLTVPPGRYDLVIDLAAATVVIADVELR